MRAARGVAGSHMPNSRSRSRKLKPFGRPRVLAGGKRVTLYLDSATLERARKLGSGNVSEGIRRALAS